jgi:hypothetical protein
MFRPRLVNKLQQLAIEAQQVPKLRRVLCAGDGGLGVLQKVHQRSGSRSDSHILVAGMAYRSGRGAVGEIVGSLPS